MNKQFTLSINIVLFLLIYTFSMPTTIRSQNLWNDRSISSPIPNIRKGLILKLQVREDIQIEFQYNQNKIDSSNIEIRPVRDVLPDLPSASKNIESAARSSVSSNQVLEFMLPVRVDKIQSNGLVQFTGSKRIVASSNFSSQDIRVSGFIDQGDIQENKKILSSNVFDLRITIRGYPSKKIQKIKEPAASPSTQESRQTNPVNNEETQETPAASNTILSKEQREALLKESIERILGELNFP